MIEVVLPGPFRAAVSDMDGLLLDSETAWFRAECELMARYGGAFSDSDRAATIGRSMDRSDPDLRGTAGLAVVEERLASAPELVDLARASYAGPHRRNPVRASWSRRCVVACRSRWRRTRTDRSWKERSPAPGSEGFFDAEIVTADQT